MKRQKGFTLVEILVSISILSIIGVLILNVFSGALRGGNKAQILLAIKQNGQSILENMDKTIRGADQVVCVERSLDSTSADGSLKNTIVIVKNGVYTRYRFFEPALPPATAANGKIWQDNPNPVIEDVNPAHPRVCTNVMSLSGEVTVLTDTNTKSGVSIRNGLFTRNKQSGFKDVITIGFDIAQGVGVASGTSSAIDPVHFETTIQLR